MENFETHIKCSVKGWLEVAYQISPLENPWSQIYWQMCKVFGIRPTDYSHLKAYDPKKKTKYSQVI